MDIRASWGPCLKNPWPVQHINTPNTLSFHQAVCHRGAYYLFYLAKGQKKKYEAVYLPPERGCSSIAVRVCLCVCAAEIGRGLEVSTGAGMGTRRKIQILICSLPQETTTISRPPPQLESGFRQQCGPDNSSTCDSPSVAADSRR